VSTPTTDHARASPPRASMFSVLRTVITGHRAAAACLMVAAMLAGLAESTILALVAQAATALVEGSDEAAAALGPLDVSAPVPVLLGVAGALALVRLGLHIVVAYLPSRMAADTQARIRRGLFDSYSRSTWSTQAAERDGHLQELLTNQIGQATQGLNQTGNLFSSASTFLTLVLSAFLLGPVVALVVLLTAACLAAGLRPLGKHARRHSAALSASCSGTRVPSVRRPAWPRRPTPSAWRTPGESAYTPTSMTLATTSCASSSRVDSRRACTRVS
jgi:ABC-type multidrug transport system fused ATPase/permease subunit